MNTPSFFVSCIGDHNAALQDAACMHFNIRLTRPAYLFNSSWTVRIQYMQPADFRYSEAHFKNPKAVSGVSHCLVYHFQDYGLGFGAFFVFMEAMLEYTTKTSGFNLAWQTTYVIIDRWIKAQNWHLSSSSENCSTQDLFKVLPLSPPHTKPPSLNFSGNMNMVSWFRVSRAL